MAELVDAHDSDSCVPGRGGSIPLVRTIAQKKSPDFLGLFYFISETESLYFLSPLAMMDSNLVA